MSKAKAKTITGIIGVMVAMILYGLHRLYPEAYLVVLGALGVVGYVAGLVLLYRWTRPEERVRAYLAPPMAEGGGPSQSLRDSSPGGGAKRAGKSGGETTRAGAPSGASRHLPFTGEANETVKVWEPGETAGGPSQSLRDSSPRRGESQERGGGETVRAVETGIDPAKLNEIIGEVGEWEKVTA